MLAVVGVALVAGGCQREKRDGVVGQGTAWVPIDAAVAADASPCVQDCVRRNQMRAVAAEHILAECMTECGFRVTQAFAELPDLQLDVPAEALHDVPYCARLFRIVNQFVTCPDIPVDLRHQTKGMLEAMIETLETERADPAARHRIDLQCRQTAIMIVEGSRGTSCPLELGGKP